ncbi:hypothetical protein HMPREF3213_00293 [Heyndrickxia coagulans]|uniref:Uncharacterized protein n=1 Tax=Heyndrickxia coagulans TaxID=1398 RepID=A0A133L2F4_HEYCO|nr:hypothetical protein HMPREF3213_00293 [Heyndrickxia coagulans]
MMKMLYKMNKTLPLLLPAAKSSSRRNRWSGLMEKLKFLFIAQILRKRPYGKISVKGWK